MGPGVVTHKIRPTSLGVAFVLLGAAIVAAWNLHGGGVWIVAGILGPDLAFLAAIGAPHAPGRLPGRAVVPYNMAHHPAGPALALVGAAGASSASLGLFAIAWLSHLAWDRGVGYGLRGPAGEITDGFVRPGVPQ